MAHDRNTSTQETEAGRYADNQKPAWSTQQASDQPGLLSQILSQKNQNQKKQQQNTLGLSFQFLLHLAVGLLCYIVTLFNFSHGGFVIGCLVFAVIDNVVVTFFKKYFLLFLIVCICVWVCSCEMQIF